MLSYPECIKNDTISEIYSSQIRDMLKHFCEIKQASLHSPKICRPWSESVFEKKHSGKCVIKFGVRVLHEMATQVLKCHLMDVAKTVTNI